VREQPESFALIKTVSSEGHIQLEIESKICYESNMIGCVGEPLTPSSRLPDSFSAPHGPPL